MSFSDDENLNMRIAKEDGESISSMIRNLSSQDIHNKFSALERLKSPTSNIIEKGFLSPFNSDMHR
jgi:hypothetical protein